jgi:predicted RNA-binding protein with TRAM domain
LNFNSYSPNGFSVGIEGGREGVIIDLGTPEELKGKYGYSETVGGGQGFASIDVKSGKALILKDYKSGKLQELTNSAELFRSPSDETASVPVKLGHVYLLRITDTSDKTFEMFAKVLVVAYTPGESVTVRWQVMSSSSATAKL